MKEAEIEMKYYKILLTCKNELTNYNVYSFSWHIKLKLKTKLLHFYISSFSFIILSAIMENKFN